MSRSKNRKIADLISGGTFDDGVVAASEVTGLATVATSGSFSDLSNQPTPFDPSTLATVATTGAYSALSGKPSLGTASTQATGAFATAAQGTLAASAVQPNTNPTFGTVSASSLTGIGSIDATTAAAIGAAGVGGYAPTSPTTGTNYEICWPFSSPEGDWTFYPSTYSDTPGPSRNQFRSSGDTLSFSLLALADGAATFRGNLKTAGSHITCSFRLVKNGSVVSTVTTNSTSFVNKDISTSFSAGDQIQMQFKSSFYGGDVRLHNAVVLSGVQSRGSLVPA